MTSDEPRAIWLEAGARRVDLGGNLAIGRAPSNHLVLDSPKVSRRHAVIHVQNEGEFWLIDLGEQQRHLRE